MQGAVAHALRAKIGRSGALVLSPVAAAGAAGAQRESDLLVLPRRRHQSPARNPQRRNSPGECPPLQIDRGKKLL